MRNVHGDPAYTDGARRLKDEMRRPQTEAGVLVSGYRNGPQGRSGLAVCPRHPPFLFTGI